MSGTGMLRTRWAAIGAACAVSLGAGGLLTASAARSSGERAVFVSITPCRIMDTRPGTDNRGPRTAPLGSGDTYTIPVHGTNADCTIPTDAVAVSLNVTSLNTTSDSFLTVFPAGAQRPTASSLNWRAGQPPTPNAVMADLPADGRLSFFNLAGSVDVITDVNGYYLDHNHDDRYYRKTQVDAALAGKVDAPTGTGQILVGPTEFQEWGVPGPTWVNNIGTNSIVATTGTPCFVAPVALPDGATVTSFSIQATDTSTSALAVALRADPYGGVIATEMARAVTTGTANVEQTASDSTIVSPVVTNSTHVYSMDFCMDTSMVFFGAKVTYTHP